MSAYVYEFCESISELCVEILDDPEAGIASNPHAENGVISICEGQTVYFENTSVNAAYYEWNFSIGFSDEITPSFTYQSPGTYEVELVAFNECMCSDTTSVTVEVINAMYRKQSVSP